MASANVRLVSFLSLLVAGMFPCDLTAEVRLEQVVSRESPSFRCQSARMTVGRDGFVYLTSEHVGKGFCLRLSRDGQQKLGGEVIAAIQNATANADGTIATANAHFNHSLNLYDAQFQKRTAADDFLVNDQVGWDAPSHVEAGASGEFYGMDQHRNRVVRVGSDGKVKGVHPIRAAQEADWGKPYDFRINEKLQSFYWLANGHLIRTSLDGATEWKVAVPVHYRWETGSQGSMDVDDSGVVYLMEGISDVVKRLNGEGQPLEPIQLDMGDLKPTAANPINSVRIWGQELIVRRVSPTELFQVYDLTTGKRKAVASIDYEQVAVTFPSLTWVNGEQIPIEIAFRAGTMGRSPRFRIWITPFGISDWRELTRDVDSKITVPADYAGLYQVKISPEVIPQQVDTPSEYLVREIVEVRRPNTPGTVAVVTPLNRTHYSLSDEILRGRVIARSPKALVDVADVQLRELRTDRVVAVKAVTLKKSADMPGQAVGEFEIDPKAHGILTPGEYRLEVEAGTLTGVDQRITLGLGTKGRKDFRTTLYGDYGLTSPQRNVWEAADSAATHADRMSKLGVNQFVNRIQQLSLDFSNDDDGRGLLNRLKQRLQADPLAVTPERVEFGSAHHAIAGIYSANGWREFLMLVYMDGGLPLGTGFDRRTPAQFAESIRRYTESLASYRGFEGWAWVANWWLYEPEAKFTSADEKARYAAALKAAPTGPWDPILDQVEDRKYGFAVDAQATFNKALRDVEQTLGTKRTFTTASAGPYRRPEVLPEVNFANVTEIDIHYQAEQITTPDWVPHGVDVSRRRGQSAWVHPELWNDFGTGEQILPLTWLAVLRGVDGIGTSGNIPNWSAVQMDSRLGYHGTPTVFRSIHRVIHELSEPLNLIRQSTSPWNDSDRVGIIVSPRQQKTETFGNGVGSPTFSRQFEAYQSFLYANCSARFVSLEEVRTRFLAAPPSKPLNLCFDALVIVSQTVELEPEWQTFLSQAKSAGVKILIDGTSRPAVFAGAEPLGLTFDVIEKEHSANSDYAHVVYPARFVANADALEKTIRDLKSGSRRPRDVARLHPAAEGHLRPVIFVQEQDAVGGRFVSVVNNTPSALSPGQLRKLGRAISTRAPVCARLTFEPAPGQKVFDLFTRQEVGIDVVADLRDSYARLYWVGSGATPLGKEPTSGLSPQHSFGPHLRDITISADGSTALVNAFSWDHNLYGLDLTTGAVKYRQRIGDHFAYGPQAMGKGFVAQGYDLNSAEGYHLYSLGLDGKANRRFAVPAVPGCLTAWAFTAWIQDHVNNFVTPATGKWIAASGNLGLAVWDSSGTLLWQDDWSATRRQSPFVAALGTAALIQADGMSVRARAAMTGNDLWTLNLANSGEIQGLHVSGDGQTLVVQTTSAGGRVFLVKEGQIIGRLPTPADDLSVSADGRVIAVTTGHQLKVFERAPAVYASGPGLYLRWLAQGDDQLRFPRISADGKRIAVCSEIGTLSVFSVDGMALHKHDELGIVVPAWMPDGDLVIAGWNGAVARLNETYQDRWRTHVRTNEVLDKTTAVAVGQRTPEPPTSRLTSWVAAETRIPDRPNLLGPNQFITRWMMGDNESSAVHPTNDLADGKYSVSAANPAPGLLKADPWLKWYDHGMIESGWRGEFALVVDTFNKQLRIDAITFVEDPAHPESWLRDMRCESWDADSERWIVAQYLTSDSAVHSHTLKRPIEAARIRFTKADGHAWPVGNVRLQELMLHGEVLGASHPDVVARRPVAVLFDENVASVKSSYEHGHNNGLKFVTGPDAFSGGNYVTLPAGKNQTALWQPPFGHMTPNWWFEVVEKPEPGQYRYLQFTVKSLAPETKGVTVRVGPSHYGGVAVHLGEPTACEGAVQYQDSGTVPLQWHTVTIDLWKQLPENQRGKPFNIGAMSLGTIGGPAAIDRIRLGRTLEDLQKKE